MVVESLLCKFERRACEVNVHVFYGPQLQSPWPAEPWPADPWLPGSEESMFSADLQPSRTGCPFDGWSARTTRQHGRPLGWPSLGKWVGTSNPGIILVQSQGLPTMKCQAKCAKAIFVGLFRHRDSRSAWNGCHGPAGLRYLGLGT